MITRLSPKEIKNDMELLLVLRLMIVLILEFIMIELYLSIRRIFLIEV